MMVRRDLELLIKIWINVPYSFSSVKIPLLTGDNVVNKEVLSQ